MRITGGEWRSRRLRGPGRSSTIRPTPDAMRERVFAVLGDAVADGGFLDLYAGTGVVGLEALSRGASSALFVDRHPAAVSLIEANCSKLCPDPIRTRVVRAPAAAAVARLARRGDRFRIAWADPPFELWPEGLDVLALAFEGGVIEDDGLACLECPERAGVAAVLPEGLELVRDLVGGASRVVVLHRRRA